MRGLQIVPVETGTILGFPFGKALTPTDEAESGGLRHLDFLSRPSIGALPLAALAEEIGSRRKRARIRYLAI